MLTLRERADISTLQACVVGSLNCC